MVVVGGDMVMEINGYCCGDGGVGSVFLLNQTRHERLKDAFAEPEEKSRELKVV